MTRLCLLSRFPVSPFPCYPVHIATAYRGQVLRNNTAVPQTVNVITRHDLTTQDPRGASGRTSDFDTMGVNEQAICQGDWFDGRLQSF
jgi:hypothetical protein